MLNSNEICLPQSLSAELIGALGPPNTETLGDVHERPERLRKRKDHTQHRPSGLAFEAGPGFALAVPSLNEWIAEPMRLSSPGSL
jgi:hypothetical protein